MHCEKNNTIVMQCTKCNVIKPFEEFSYKNVNIKIYYLYCDICRNKTLISQSKYKEKAIEEYNLRKKTNIVNCECGISYICFRDFHVYRHINSKKHKKLLLELKNDNI